MTDAQQRKLSQNLDKLNKAMGLLITSVQQATVAVEQLNRLIQDDEGDNKKQIVDGKCKGCGYILNVTITGDTYCPNTECIYYIRGLA